jgi:hypothetical protein
MSTPVLTLVMAAAAVGGMQDSIVKMWNRTDISPLRRFCTLSLYAAGVAAVASMPYMMNQWFLTHSTI